MVGWMDGWMEWMNKWMDRWMNRWIDSHRALLWLQFKKVEDVSEEAFQQVPLNGVLSEGCRCCCFH